MDKTRFDASTPDAQNKREEQGSMPSGQSSLDQANPVTPNANLQDRATDGMSMDSQDINTQELATKVPLTVTPSVETATDGSVLSHAQNNMTETNPSANNASDTSPIDSQQPIINTTADQTGNSANSKQTLFHSKEIGTKTVKKKDPFEKQKQEQAQRKKKQAKQLKITLPIVIIIVIAIIALVVFLVVKGMSETEQNSKNPASDGASEEETLILTHSEAAQELYNQSDEDPDAILKYFEDQSAQAQSVIDKNSLYLAEMTTYLENNHLDLALETASQIDTNYLTDYQYAILYSSLAEIYYMQGDTKKADQYIKLLDERGLSSNEESLEAPTGDLQDIQNEVYNAEVEKEEEE